MTSEGAKMDETLKKKKLINMRLSTLKSQNKKIQNTISCEKLKTLLKKKNVFFFKWKISLKFILS